MARRATYIKQVRAAADNVVVLDVGGVSPLNPEERELLTSAGLAAMAKMDYDALNVALNEAPILEEAVDEAAEEDGTAVELTYVSCNVEADGESLADFFAPYTIVERGGAKIGVVGVSSTQVTIPQDVFNREQYHAIDPVETLSRTVESLRDEVDMVVVLATLHYDEVDRIRNVSGVDMVLTNSMPAPYREHEGVLTYSANVRSENVYRIDLVLDVESDEVSKVVFHEQALGTDVESDDDMLELVRKEYRVKKRMQAKGGKLDYMYDLLEKYDDPKKALEKFHEDREAGKLD